jgi:hypothetical protein
MQRDLVVVILYGSIYNQYKIVKYKVADIIKFSVLGTISSLFIYRCRLELDYIRLELMFLFLSSSVFQKRIK